MDRLSLDSLKMQMASPSGIGDEVLNFFTRRDIASE
jgi:hypothetical protein